MNARLAIPALALAGALWLTPGVAGAQSETERKPERGKVDGVEDEAREARSDDDGVVCGDCEGRVLFLFRMIGAAFHVLFTPPDGVGQGYQRYPYAEPDEPDAFARDGVTGNRRFGAFTASYFNDQAVGGTLQAGEFALEGTNGMFNAGVEYTLYREPTQTDTDWLHLARISVGAVPRLGRWGFSRVAIAARGVVLDNGYAAWGPELEFGVQAFPVRPWGVSANARGAILGWTWAGTSAFADLRATTSYFLGHTEIMAGWRYTKVGSAAAFNGPTAGVRLWF